jgi:hypothetical protein
MLVALDNVVKVESVPLNFNFFSLRACAQIVKSREIAIHPQFRLPGKSLSNCQLPPVLEPTG